MNYFNGFLSIAQWFLPLPIYCQSNSFFQNKTESNQLLDESKALHLTGGEAGISSGMAGDPSFLSYFQE